MSAKRLDERLKGYGLRVGELSVAPVPARDMVYVPLLDKLPDDLDRTVYAVTQIGRKQFLLTYKATPAARTIYLNINRQDINGVMNWLWEHKFPGTKRQRIT